MAVEYVNQETYNRLQETRQTIGRRGRLPSLAPGAVAQAVPYMGIRAVSAIPVSIDSGATPDEVLSTPALLLGWTVTETSGTAAATIDIYDSRDSEGTLAARLALPAGGMSAVWAGWPGIACRSGVSVSRGTGAWAGVLYLAPIGVPDITFSFGDYSA